MNNTLSNWEIMVFVLAGFNAEAIRAQKTNIDKLKITLVYRNKMETK